MRYIIDSIIVCVIVFGVLFYQFSEFKCRRGLNPSPVLQEISSKCQFVSGEIRNMNYGGCGIFAYEMGTRLNKIGINCVPLIVGSRKYYASEKRRLDLHQFGGSAPNHVLLLLIDYNLALDSDGLHSLGKRDSIRIWHSQLIPGSYTFTELKLAIDHSEWNSRFNRAQVPKLTHVLDSLIGTIHVY